MVPPVPESKPRLKPSLSSGSLRIDSSKELSVSFKKSPEHQHFYKMDPPGPGPFPSSVSVKSDSSKELPILFASLDQSSYVDSPGTGPRSRRRSKSTPSFMSLKSDSSKELPILFSRDSPLEDQREPGPKGQLDAIFKRMEEDILKFVKEQLQGFHRLLLSEYPESLSKSEEDQSSREAVLNITLDFLRRMKQEQLAEHLYNRSSVGVHSDKLKRGLKQNFSSVFEGVTKAGNPTLLQRMYTELYITEGGPSEVNQEHEVRHIETASRKPTTEETIIACEDIFKRPAHRQRPIRAELTRPPIIRAQLKRRKSIRSALSEGTIRTVLTTGVAGIGKTVLTQKFSLDWAEGRANQDIELLFPFTFRELNVLRDTEYSLVGLLHHFFSQTKGVWSFENLQVLFIFDGLDECRLPLDFSRTRVLTDPTESASVEELLVNLIRGDLLPSARLWITTRPAAANQIPAECVSMVTEVRGFTDPQKEQYFRKRFRDEEQATAVISHVKTSYILYIMCHIPIFCWILSTVLIFLMETKRQLPHTLTQMYIHFLVIQAKVKNIKYHERSGTDLHWTPETKEMVRSLGKLAFEQLQKGNLIFYESDLSDCGLDATAASVYSGIFTQVFREESSLYQNKVYCFIHLSVQEFLAALHVHETFFSSGVNLLSTHHSTERSDPEAFYHSAVDRALQSPNGHLDLFLRFLLGLSLPTNQSLLLGLLTHTGSGLQTNQETLTYIKKKLNEGLSSERILNLFHCLKELNDNSLVEGIQNYVREGHLSWITSSTQWSALAFFLLSSDSDLVEFDLRKYQQSETALLGLLPVVKASTKAILCGCNLSPNSCGPLVSVISFLAHLDLSNNDLQDLGVELLCSGLRISPCRLKTLRLSGCLVSEKGGASLASALTSAHCHMRELNLSYNHPGPSAELLIALLDSPNCPLEILRLHPAGEQWMVPGLKKYFCNFSMDPNTAQKNLLLSEDRQTVRRVEEEQLYPDHDDRFTSHAQVVSSTGLTGRCYWEVQWSGWLVEIAVSYRGIRRRGNREECMFGCNDQSWALRIDDGRYSALHKKIPTPVPSTSSRDSGRVAVFLDTEAGALTFYEVRSGGELFHLHTFCSSFTEPLFPGFRVWCEGDSISIVDLGRA